ncbi:MAG: HpcH/HpaI aldolase family protein [Caldilineaceae bacterium]
MNGREIRERLHSGKRVYGTMIVSESPKWPAALASVGLDFVFIDTEHIAQDRNKLSWMCQLYAALDLAPIVRIPAPDPYLAAMMRDLGAQGVIAPYVESVEQVQALVGAVKYRPLKGDRLYKRLRGEEPLEPELEHYLQERNDDGIVVVNIESQPAMAILDDIADVEGVDALLIGPHDLSCNLGIPEQYFHEKFVAAVDKIITTARGHGIGAGIHLVYPGAFEQEVRWSKMAANLVIHGMDITAMRAGLRADFDALKDALEEVGEEEAMDAINI